MHIFESVILFYFFNKKEEGKEKKRAISLLVFSILQLFLQGFLDVRYLLSLVLSLFHTCTEGVPCAHAQQ